MANAPRNKQKKQGDVTAVIAPRIAVYAKNGEFPTEKDEQPDWRCVDISNGAGVIPTCELVRDLAVAGTRLREIRLEGKANWIVEVWLLDEKGKRQRCLFMGEVVETQFALSKDGEHESATATIPHYWFGSLCLGQEVWNPQTEATTIVHHNLEFSPLIDGAYVSNRAVREDTFDTWIDPESCRTEDARNYQGATVEDWTLRDAVRALCGMLNFQQEFVNNPSIDDSWADDAPPMRNIELQRGHYLIDYLTMLLPPFGYDWFIDPTIDKQSNQALPTIKLFPRGILKRDLIVDLQLDGIGKSITNSQVESAAFNYNIANTKNEITLHGSLKQTEFTIELFRAWPVASDGAWDPNDPLSKVGRKWVANEAGDYTNLRPEISEVPEFGADYVPKRRHCEDLLRWKDEDTQTARAHPVLEYSLDNGTSWDVVKKDWHRLADECGVWFSDPYEELLAASPPRLRITCTLISDRRVSATYVDSHSINGKTVEALIDARDRFHYRQIEVAGDFQSQLSGDADTVDDSGQPMTDYLEPLGEIQRTASIGVAPVLHGIHLDKQIGQLVRSITGRQISFNAVPFDGSPEGTGERFPQITGLRYTFVPEFRTHISVTPYASQNPDQRVRRRPKA